MTLMRFPRYLLIRNFQLKHPNWNILSKSDLLTEQYLVRIQNGQGTKKAGHQFI